MKVQEKWILDSILLQHIKIKKNVFKYNYAQLFISEHFFDVRLMCFPLFRIG